TTFYVAVRRTLREGGDTEPATPVGDASLPDPDDEQILGMAAAMWHSPRYAFFGYFIVKPRYRGLGIGRAIFHAIAQALAATQPATIVGLDGVPEQVPRYERWLGFRVSHCNVRYSGTLTRLAEPARTPPLDVRAAADVPLDE